ncbi:NERD domain-containing protein [Pseudogulbenkiania ferrooxidans]|nr:NERD domain-containing protein [Pseudogulbenkiania ferrooxidans]
MPKTNSRRQEKEADLPSLEELMSLLQYEFSTPKISRIAEEIPALVETLKKLHPVKTAATFAGLLANKGLQSNCFRLEALVHLAIAYCEGDQTPMAQFTSHAFKAVGQGACGRLEDPAEDVFTGSIYSARGNYRILEGVWESAAFFLQRFVNIVDRLPDTGGLDHLKESVHALLRLSDLLCERAALNRNDLGNPIPEATLPSSITKKLADARQIVRFSKDELFSAGIKIRDLSPFIFDPRNRRTMLEQVISHTDLERRPISTEGDHLVVLLPTAISIAIRRFLIEVLGTGKNREIILRALAKEYSKTLSETPLLGSTQSGPVSLIRTDAGVLASVLWEVDVGRFLSMIFFMDDLDGFENEGFSGGYRGLPGLGDAIEKHIDSCIEKAHQSPLFREGILLLVGCGIGRGISIPLRIENRLGWKIDSISAPDLYTLSWTPQMRPLNLWRLYSAEEKLNDLGIGLQNANGLLNLVAWSRSLEGHLVPHAQIPTEMANDGGLLIVTQNALLDLRHEVATSWGLHVEQDIDGFWRLVRREGQSYFEEDEKFPIYATVDGGPNHYPLGACITQQRTWWFELIVSADRPCSHWYERWTMLATWMRRAAPVLDLRFPNLPAGALLWRCKFDYVLEPHRFDRQEGTAEDALSAIKMTCNVSDRIVTLEISDRFDLAIFNSENVAESALVSALVWGIAEMAGMDVHIEDVTPIINEIVADPQARQSHRFVANKFRDFIDALAKTKPITINHHDDAELKLGLGWRIRPPEMGAEILGKEPCTAFLNGLVTSLEEEICSEIRKYNRQGFIEVILLNSEVASREREYWHKTSAAMLALRNDKQAALETMANHEFELNGVLQASRILIEMAICESPLEEGLIPGQLDISRLMARASALFHFGGWSDAIRWDVMEPQLVIQPLGDVYVSQDFINDIAERFAHASSAVRFRYAAENYAENLEERPWVTETTDDMDGLFLSAWAEEFGVSLHDFRCFVDRIEEMGIHEDQPLLCLPRSRLVAALEDSEAGYAVVRALTLEPRLSWRSIPDGFDVKDRQPWRLRRLLSAVRKPLLQINNDSDPLIVVAPGMLRESFGYIVDNYYQGNFPDRQLGPAMRRFSGHGRLKRGMEFNTAVADRLKQLGWEVACEIELTKILGRNLGKDWGDIDVLAWHPTAKRILIIECKNVQFRKTYGEIAEQLSDFRGEIRSNGKPDMLRKHLDRVLLAREHIATVRKYVSIPDVLSIESHLVFKNPVPMQYAAHNIGNQVCVSTFDDLDQI